MTIDEKLAAILAAVQIDPGKRGLARDPVDNLFTATEGDFRKACRLLAESKRKLIAISTGFFIPDGLPPAFETDGPLGAFFLRDTLDRFGYSADVVVHPSLFEDRIGCEAMDRPARTQTMTRAGLNGVLNIAIELSGPSADGRHWTMRGTDITDAMAPFMAALAGETFAIAIGDGGNEIGMGRIPAETIAKNIPNGERVHCTVPADHLVVAGVSNWGAYALAAGVAVVVGAARADAKHFDAARERKRLIELVESGPLVDGVTGKQTATVDGLSWDEYAEPLIRIREILEQA